VKKLSPATQAVLDVLINKWQTDPYEMDIVAIAAALRAAVAHTQQHHGHDVYGHDVWECDADELLAIADELEGNG